MHDAMKLLKENDLQSVRMVSYGAFDKLKTI